MTDWRTKPRTGKSQFYPLISEIQKRLAMGETYKQIHDDLTSRKQLEIGYDQLSRYIRNHLKPTKVEKRGQTIPVSTKEIPAIPTQPPKTPVSRSDFRKLRSEVDDMDLEELINTGEIIYRNK